MSKERFYDNTMISCFRACPRRFYFRHVKHWQPTGFVPPLAFGLGWHDAMDIVWTTICTHKEIHETTEQVAMAAYHAFVEKWLKEGGPHPEDTSVEDMALLSPRTPMVALEMLYHYIEERRPFLSEVELIDVERPFAVPLDPDESLFYCGRLDKVFRYRDKVYIKEHKTSSLYSKSSGFRPMFLDSFSPNSQVDGYLHALHMLYGKEAGAVWIDAALVHKEHHDIFKIIPIERQIDQLESWLWETRSWIDLIEANKKMLEQPLVWSKSKEGDGEWQNAKYMPAFPKNTSACQDFGRSCSYIGMCKSWSNPIDKPLPPDMHVDKWSPFERLELEKIGLTEGDKINA